MTQLDVPKDHDVTEQQRHPCLVEGQQDKVEKHRLWIWTALTPGDLVSLRVQGNRDWVGTVESRTSDGLIIWIRDDLNERKLFHFHDCLGVRLLLAISGAPDAKGHLKGRSEGFDHISREVSPAMILELSVRISRKAALLEAEPDALAQNFDDLAALTWILRCLEDVEATITGLSEANRRRSEVFQRPAPFCGKPGFLVSNSAYSYE